MQRWQITMGLATLAVGMALLVPSWPSGSRDAPQGDRPRPGPPPTTPDQPLLAPGRLALSATADQSSILLGDTEDRFLVFAVQADRDPRASRRPVHLAVVMDTSGSMAARGKLSHARAAAASLVDQLGPEDTFSLTTFDDQATVRIPSQPVTDPGRLQRSIRQLRTGGGTNLFDGLEQGLAEVLTDPRDGVRRVVLLSDGQANIGVTDPLALRREAGGHTSDGVTVSTIGLGLDFNEDLLSAMADAAGGSYHFADQPQLLAPLLADELEQLSTVVARETTLQLDLADGVEILEVYGYDLARGAGGDSLFLGDLYAGETRKLVARVHIPATHTGSVVVGEASVTHTDAESRSRHRVAAQLTVEVTRSARSASASVDATARKHATRAQIGGLIEQAARDFEDGNLSANQAAYGKAAELAHRFHNDFEDREMLESLAYLNKQQTAFARSPASEEGGQAEIKRAKERARAYTH